jgi:small-conductance mechanosensitive channel
MQWLNELLAVARQYLPNMLAALALLVVGWLLATLARFVANRMAAGMLERLKGIVPLDRAVDESGVRVAAPRIVASFVFWGVLILAVAAAVEALGITVATELVGQLAYYLPAVLAAVAVLAAGVILGRLARRTASGAARSAGIARSAAVGQTAQAVVLFVAVVVALEEIGIDAQLLVSLVTVAVGAAFLSAALAFALGAKSTVSNLVSAHYVAQSYRVGQKVRIGDIEGEIQQLSPTAVVMHTSEGRVTVPAARFSEEVSVLRPEVA